MPDVLGVIAQVGRGHGLTEISREFDAVMDAVRENGGSGELTIKLQIQGKAWNPETNQLTEVGVTHSISSKRPKRRIGASTFFVTREGELTRNNPEQMEMYDQTEHHARSEV